MSNDYKVYTTRDMCRTLLQHLQTSDIPGLDAILEETEAMLARGKTDLPISTCFAAGRSDKRLLQRLLKKGSDPNETDRNGRTALVCGFSFLA